MCSADTSHFFGGYRRMAQHEHSRGKEHHHPHGETTSAIHRKWWFWAVVALMLAAMLMYVATDDEAIGPGGEINQQVPADAE
jgi:hypothetical protein